MKKILAILFAVVISISAFVLPAAAAYADGRFTVDSVAEGGEYILNPSNGPSYDAQGYYNVSVYTGSNWAQFDRDGQRYVLFEAPAGYYVYFSDSLDLIGRVYDRIEFGYNFATSSFSWYCYLNDELTIIRITSVEDYVFITPYLPVYSVGSVQDTFFKSSAISVTKLGDQVPTPVNPVPDQSLPRIFQVWQSVTGWIADGLSSVAGVFYAAGQLTLIGTLAVISVGIALIFLLIAFIRKFLFLRG